MQKADIQQSIEFVNILQFPNLYLRLCCALVRASNGANAEDFNFVYSRATIVYSLDFLNQKGRNYLTKIQLFTRLFTSFLIKAKKPMHGISLIQRAIKVLRPANEQVSSLNTQFALLCLKARCL